MCCTGLSAQDELVLEKIGSRPSFLMVGTVEPRKRHEQVLNAFEQLWAAGSDATLVIAGKAGWMVDKLLHRLANHPERDSRLLWLKGSSDELLDRMYKASTCLIAASLNEGFGLPLIEAAKHGLPVIARDIPVFREVAGDHAFYFSDDSPTALAQAIRTWLDLNQRQAHPRSQGMPWLTWAQSARRIEDALLPARRTQPM